MLRKLFQGGGNNDPAALTSWNESGDNAKGVASNVSDFAHYLAQLNAFEERAMTVVNVLSRHCQAITEICSSASNVTGKIGGLFNITGEIQPMYCGEVMELVHEFRTTRIAPLQALLANTPALRVKCEHRSSAFELMLRYDRKVDDLQKSSKAETTRLQRNRAKLQLASERFQELDTSVKRAIKALVSNDIAAILGDSVQELLLQAQLIAAQRLVDNASCLQDYLSGTTDSTLSNNDDTPLDNLQPKERDEQEASDSDGGDNNSPCESPVLLSSPPKLPSSVVDEHRHSLCISSTLKVQTDTIAGTSDSKYEQGTRAWELRQHMRESISAGLDLADCVRLPEGYPRDEWIAVHIVDFVNEIKLLFGMVSECCTPEACPQMSAGPCYTYMWADGTAQVAPISLPATEYVQKLLCWVEAQTNNPALFPTDNTNYPTTFVSNTASVILKRLFRVYAHMYHHHFTDFQALGADTHLGCCFKRFAFFVKEHALVEQKELNALRKLIQTLYDPTITYDSNPMPPASVLQPASPPATTS